MRIRFFFFFLFLSAKLLSQENKDFQFWQITNFQAYMNNNWQVFFKQRNNVNGNNFKKEMNFAEAGILYDISEMINSPFHQVA